MMSRWLVAGFCEQASRRGDPVNDSWQDVHSYPRIKARGSSPFTDNGDNGASTPESGENDERGLRKIWIQRKPIKRDTWRRKHTRRDPDRVIHTHDSTIGDASDVFVTPKLLGNSHESESGVQCIHAGGSAAHLKAIQLAVILLRCLLIEKSSWQDEMQRWDMAPYIEATDSQQSSCFILKFFCDLLRIRWESTRCRTKGRALEMMDKLAAMALNSLYPDGWFALGAAALKARDVEKALDGFTRAVQLDPDNGEAWNNIACLRNSWQLWENYSHVALDVGNIGQALEAVQMVLNMTNNKRIDTVLLERIVLDMEGRTSIIESESCRTTHNLNRTNNTCAKDLPVESVHVSSPEESIMGRSRENEHLMEFLGKILQQVVRSESSADMWGLYARWLKNKGDLTMCSEALLKQVRSYQGSDLWKDRDRFKRFSYASLELCKVYMEISSSSGSRRELFAAEMHLKNAEGFSDMEEFRDLHACLDELKTKLQSGPVAT
ncbi:TPR REGION domain-containing protein [Citrus sinensis]|nr:TPR REGION domain-containing protein [Citrus sinensis]